MSIPRRFALIVLTVALGIATIIVGVTLVRAFSLGDSTARELTRMFRGSPKAVLIGSKIYELGVIDKAEEYTHEYVIRNEGDAPLELSVGPSTCSCTLTGVPEEPVPPGKEAVVSIGFNESHKNDILKPGLLDRGISVFTNDPQNEKIHLGLIATVKRRLAISPEQLVFNINAAEENADAPHSTTAIIYSQTWEQFALDGGKCTLAGATWTVEPAAKEELQPFEAKSGYRLRVTLPATMPDGRIAGVLDFDARPAGQESGTLSVNMQGEVAGHLSWFGQKIQTNRLSEKVLVWGPLPAGKAAKESFVMKINREPKSLAIEGIESEPAFLQVRMKPVGDIPEKSGVYRIEVELPPDAPRCNHMSDGNLGRVRIKTNHPCFPVIEFKLFFAVVDE